MFTPGSGCLQVWLLMQFYSVYFFNITVSLSVNLEVTVYQHFRKTQIAFHLGDQAVFSPVIIQIIFFLKIVNRKKLNQQPYLVAYYRGAWVISVFFYLAFCCQVALARCSLRIEEGIPGSILEDFLLSVTLYPCVLTQMITQDTKIVTMLQLRIIYD